MASKHLDETWIASMKDLMTNYADTIVSNIVESYGAEGGGEKSKRKKMIPTGRGPVMAKKIILIP